MFLEEANFQFIITAMTPSTKALHNAFNIGLIIKLDWNRDFTITAEILTHLLANFYCQ